MNTVPEWHLAGDDAACAAPMIVIFAAAQARRSRGGAVPTWVFDARVLAGLAGGWGPRLCGCRDRRPDRGPPRPGEPCCGRTARTGRDPGYGGPVSVHGA